jgi:hypothetical protein
LGIIKDSYFNEKSKIPKSNILEESFEGEVTTPSVSNDPFINRYADAITRTVKKVS